MAYRGTHQRRRPLWTGRPDLDLAEVALAMAAEVFVLIYLLAAVFTGR